MSIVDAGIKMKTLERMHTREALWDTRLIKNKNEKEALFEIKNNELSLVNKQISTMPTKMFTWLKPEQTDKLVAENEPTSIKWKELTLPNATTWTEVTDQYAALFGSKDEALAVIQSVNADLMKDHPNGLPKGSVINLPLDKQFKGGALITPTNYSYGRTQESSDQHKSDTPALQPAANKPKPAKLAGKPAHQKKDASISPSRPDHAVTKGHLDKTPSISTNVANEHIAYYNKQYESLFSHLGYQPSTDLVKVTKEDHKNDAVQSLTGTIAIPTEMMVTSKNSHEPTFGEFVGTLCSKQATQEGKNFIWNKLHEFNNNIKDSDCISGLNIVVYKNNVSKDDVQQQGVSSDSPKSPSVFQTIAPNFYVSAANRIGFQGAWQGNMMGDPTSLYVTTKVYAPVAASLGAGFWAVNQGMIAMEALCNKDSKNYDPAFGSGKAVETMAGCALTWNKSIDLLTSNNPSLAKKLLTAVTPEQLRTYLFEAVTNLNTTNPKGFEKIKNLMFTVVGKNVEGQFSANSKVLQYGFVAEGLVHLAGLGNKCYGYMQESDPTTKREKGEKIGDYVLKSFPKDIAMATASAQARGLFKAGFAENAAKQAQAAQLETQAAKAATADAAAIFRGEAKVLKDAGTSALTNAKMNAGKAFGRGFVVVDGGFAAKALYDSRIDQAAMNRLNLIPVEQRDQKWQNEYHGAELAWRRHVNEAGANSVSAALNLTAYGAIPNMLLNVAAHASCPSLEQLKAVAKAHGFEWESPHNPYLGIETSSVPADYIAGALVQIADESITHSQDQKNAAWEYTKILSDAYGLTQVLKNVGKFKYDEWEQNKAWQNMSSDSFQ